MKTKFILFAVIAALGVFIAWKSSATTSDVPVTVKIPGRNYAFGKYDVTQKQYEAVMKIIRRNSRAKIFPWKMFRGMKPWNIVKTDGAGTRFGADFDESGISPAAFGRVGTRVPRRNAISGRF